MPDAALEKPRTDGHSARKLSASARFYGPAKDLPRRRPPLQPRDLGLCRTGEARRVPPIEKPRVRGHDSRKTSHSRTVFRRDVRQCEVFRDAASSTRAKQTQHATDHRPFTARRIAQPAAARRKPRKLRLPQRLAGLPQLTACCAPSPQRAASSPRLRKLPLTAAPL